MAFPPAFDRAWDETFPPDTQAANLLGQDIRNFKIDIRERLALLSGIFANRPSNMDAVFGGANYGIIYFATDTSQIFQWNGAAWTEVTQLFTGVRLSATVPVATGGAGVDGQSLVIPANMLAVGSVVTITARVSFGGANSFGIFFGATRLFQDVGDANSNLGTYTCTVIVTGAAAQKATIIGSHTETPNASANALVINANDPAEAINGNITVKTQQTAGGAGMSHQFLTISWK